MGSTSVIAGMTSQTIENKMAPIIIIIKKNYISPLSSQYTKVNRQDTSIFEMSLLSIFEMEWKQHFLDNLPTK